VPLSRISPEKVSDYTVWIDWWKVRNEIVRDQIATTEAKIAKVAAEEERSASHKDNPPMDTKEQQVNPAEPCGSTTDKKEQQGTLVGPTSEPNEDRGMSSSSIPELEESIRIEPKDSSCTTTTWRRKGGGWQRC
jgi:hypothetical protein